MRLAVPARYALVILVSMTAVCAWSKYGGAAKNDGRRFVGSEACKSCHEEEYRNFESYSKKARSYESISRMKKGLTEAEIQGCYVCHTTGYGAPGGFRSEKETPLLKNAGCESCHGPGSAHAETGNSADIKRKMKVTDCQVCHNSERVDSFKFKPQLHGGAH